MANEIKDYGELFCSAVDTIVKERLSGIKFDQTIICKIINDKDKNQGRYVVSYNSTKFEAYSLNASYNANDEVYVQIPSGDWNEQKLIISKKTQDNKTSVTYQYPFDNYLDNTGNIIKQSSLTQGKLIANGQQSNIILWSYNIPDNYETKVAESGEAFTQYTRLGIQAQFQSWLKTQKTTNGSYGLKLRIQAEKEDENENPNAIINNENTTINTNDKYYEFVLDANDMIGDPYNFDSYFQQEKLFDISDIIKIKKMELSFYQSNNFKDNNGNYINGLIMSEIEIDQNEFNKNKTNYYQLKNGIYEQCDDKQEWQENIIYYTPIYSDIVDYDIFVKDINISFGYDINEFETDIIKIYSLGSPKYSSNIFPPEDNHRLIQMRWIHEIENGKTVAINDGRYLDYEIMWYKYSLGAYSYTAESGADWIPLSKQEVVNGEVITTIIDLDWDNYNKTADNGLYRQPGTNATWLIPNVSLAQEKIKAIISYQKNGNTQYLHSNILTFTNREEVSSMPTIDSVTALAIGCEDESFGNYYLYNQGNQLIDTSQSSVERVLKVYYKGAELQSAESITWSIPSSNTMISLESNYYGGSEPEEDPVTKNIIITRYGDKHNNDNPYDVRSNQANQQRYKIKGYYSPSNNNNTISCTVVYNGATYTATKTLHFGASGTSGSDYTLVLQFDDDINAIPYVGEDIYEFDNNGVPLYEFDTSIVKDEGYGVSAYLYDASNRLIEEEELSGKAELTWSWLVGENLIYSNEAGLKIDLNTSSFKNKIIYYETFKQPTKGESYKENRLKSNQLYILQATLEMSGTKKLTAYLPIPIYKYQKHIAVGDGGFLNSQPSYISGATQVLYSTDGYPSYYKDPYKIFFKDFAIEGEVETDRPSRNPTWKLFPDPTTVDQKRKALLPTLTSDYKLSPLGIYTEGAEYYGIQCINAGEVIWTQPILILQNRYPNSAVNAWDGKSLELNEEEGYILSAAIATGRKEEDNSFTGVMLGDWAEKAAEPIGKNTGVYGFHHGAVAYAFKDDGTAFIGKNGRGRILFNGNKGTIASQAWDLTGTDMKSSGMYIDLDDGILKMQKEPGYDQIVLSKDTYQKNKYYILKTTYTAVNSNTQEEDLNERYYRKIKVLANNITKNNYVAFASQLFVIDSYYTQCTSTDIWSDDIEYYQISFTVIDNLTNEVYLSNPTKYYFKTADAKPEDSYTKCTLDHVFNGNNKYALPRFSLVEDKQEINISQYYISNKNYMPCTYKKDSKDITYIYNLNESYYIEEYQLCAYTKSEEIFTREDTYDLAKNDFSDAETYYENNTKAASRYITLSAAASNYPLAIGNEQSESARKFKVDWNGTAYIQDGKFKGNVNADYLECDSGDIGGWEIGSNTLTGGKIELNSRKQTIKMGDNILLEGKKSKITIGSNIILDGTNSKIELISDGSNGPIKIKKESADLGYFGFIQGNDGSGVTENVGIKTTNSNYSIILESSKNIRLSAKSGGMWIEATSINVTCSAENQNGIYARFA